MARTIGVVVTRSANDDPLLEPTSDLVCARAWTATIGRLPLDHGDGYKSVLILYRTIDHHRGHGLSLEAIR